MIALQNASKKILVLICSVLLSLLLLEFGAFFISKKVKTLQSFDTQVQVNTELPNWGRNFILHPYLGYITNPQTLNYAKDGFWHKTKTVTAPKYSVSYKIGITGGSVSQRFCKGYGAQKLINTLQKTVLLGLDISLYCIGEEGWKQPQQLMGLNYSLLNNNNFDLVINIDGFNEIQKSHENANLGVSVLYPTLWNLLSYSEYDESSLRLILEAKENVRFRYKWIKYFSSEWAQKSNTLELIGKIGYNYMLKKHYELNVRLSETVGYATTPVENLTYDEKMFKMIALWNKSSVMMQDLAKRHHFSYVHIIQPNQFVKNSKPFSKEELAGPANNRHASKLISKWYPLLLIEAKKVKEKGINILDATMVFENVEKTLYVDACCHFNSLGNIILSDFILETIAEEIEQKFLKQN